MANYYFEDNTFVIEGYDQAKTFSSFLPGLAGLKGIPMWTFYVNRGQGICSFGIGDKNNPIMEFSPANIAYQKVSFQGFRTFIKWESEGAIGAIYEPFQSGPADLSVKRIMRISPNELSVEEINQSLGLKTKVTYFQIPNDDYAALARKVEIENISSTEETLVFEVLDGLPEILPYGVENAAYKDIGNLLRSWMEVDNLENGVPYYRLRSSIHDEAEVSEVKKGHFYLSFDREGSRLKPITDFEIVFGETTSLSYPDGFAKGSLSELTAQPQYCTNKVPCGFSGVHAVLKPGASTTIYTLVGHIDSVERLNSKAPLIASPAYIEQKQKEAYQLTEQLTEDIATKTGIPLFDAYCKQSYMDNFLRGGYPFLFENGKKDGFVIHLYSRKHGDLERDYNFFLIAPEYYSQGNGNFRDANQNRRSDIFFNPRVGTFNIVTFFSLIQADGYNPLGVKGTSFCVPESKTPELTELLNQAVSEAREGLKSICLGKFTPGKIFSFIAERGISLKMSEEQLLTGILSLADQQIEASFNEGYWSDHWTYNMDLIDSYLNIFPDRKQQLLFDEKSYMYFDSPARVLPRSEKYVLSGEQARQFGALVHDEEKMQKFGLSLNDTNWLKTNFGEGEIYRTHLFGKLVSLSLIKFATLDPYGMGIEMEGNKPGWNDAMNGLPGLFGSGMSETFELKRMIRFMLDVMEEYNEVELSLPEEVLALLEQVTGLLDKNINHGLSSFDYWDTVSTAREQYRDQIRYGISGKEQVLSLAHLSGLYQQMLRKIDQGIDQAIVLGDGLTPTYFAFEAVEYKQVMNEQGQPEMSGYGLPKVRVQKFAARPLPHFLEGPARWMKTLNSQEQAKSAYDTIRSSELYDTAIQMYKTSVSIDNESMEAGRIRAFTPGWLERESIFLHMSYKYLLALLSSGLKQEFFEEIKTSLVPFLDPATYGRSTLENSSFIASSVNPDPKLHGRGFVARLSGSTSEFISMWMIMMAGKQVFRMNEEKLVLALNPSLPGWLFDAQGEIAFNFLGGTEVVYHNPTKQDTYGSNKAEIKSITIRKKDGKIIEIMDSVLTGELAEEVRSGSVKRIDVVLG
ncbi:hypothetical protein D3C76_75780 [compost metagenome]